MFHAVFQVDIFVQDNDGGICPVEETEDEAPYTPDDEGEEGEGETADDAKEVRVGIIVEPIEMEGAGAGTISGFVTRIKAVPVTPMKDDKARPGFERSMRYHSTGFTRASVRDSWRVDCHGNFLFFRFKNWS